MNHAGESSSNAGIFSKYFNFPMAAEAFRPCSWYRLEPYHLIGLDLVFGLTLGLLFALPVALKLALDLDLVLT
jgi:hypothetical protein